MWLSHHCHLATGFLPDRWLNFLEAETETRKPRGSWADFLLSLHHEYRGLVPSRLFPSPPLSSFSMSSEPAFCFPTPCSLPCPPLTIPLFSLPHCWTLVFPSANFARQVFFISLQMRSGRVKGQDLQRHPAKVVGPLIMLASYFHVHSAVILGRKAGNLQQRPRDSQVVLCLEVQGKEWSNTCVVLGPIKPHDSVSLRSGLFKLIPSFRISQGT